MRLRAIRLYNVRRFANRGIEIAAISDGVNVLTAANEQGKSTCFDALHALFFESFKGTPKTIQQLRPYSGGSPLIEVDIETENGSYRLRKRFYGGRSAIVRDLGHDRIVAQADEAEQWIAQLVRGGAGGPAGLLWVQQGVTEMGAGTKQQKEEEKAARQDVLTSVAGEIETLTGGRRTVQVLDRCQAALDELVTGKERRPKTNGPYDEALRRAEALAGEQKDLADKVEELRDQLDARKSKRERLATLQDPDAAAARERDKDEAAKALRAGEEHASRLGQAENTEKLAALELKQATETLESFDAGIERFDFLKRHRTLQEQARKAAETDARSASGEEVEAARDVTVCSERVSEAEAAVTLAQKAALASAAARELEALRRKLETAETARRAAETAAAEATSLALPADKIGEIEALDERIATFEAERRARSVSVIVDYADPGDPSIRHAGKPLRQGEPLAISEPVQLEIAAVGSLTVSPGARVSVGEQEKALEAATARRAELLRALRIDGLAAARRRQAAADERSRESGRAIAQLEVLAPEGIEALRAELAKKEADAKPAEQGATASIDEARQRLAGARTALQAAQERREAARIKLAEARERQIRAETTLANTGEEFEELAGQLGAVERREAQRTTFVEAVTSTQGAFDRAERAARVLRDSAPDLATLRAAAARAATAFSNADAEIDRLRLEIVGLDARIQARADEGIEETLLETSGGREAADRRVALFEDEIATLRKLRDTLIEARSAAKEHFFGPVVNQLKPLLKLLLDDASVTFDEETLLPHRLERSGQNETFEVLSGGMREQLTILTRLAFARLLARDGRAVPVILDDALIFSDDDRIEKMFLALHRQAQDLQIIVLTCRQRAFDRLGGQGVRMVPWTPQELV